MRDDGSQKRNSLLVEQRLRRTGLEVKLDKGFKPGVYCVYVEYDQLFERVGFEAAHRTAVAYCALLRKHLGQPAGRKIGESCDGSQTDDPRRNHDLEATFLWFPIETGDGRFHDEAVREHFQMAALRAGQEWDQTQARALDRRRDATQTAFRKVLAALLDDPAYGQVDAVTKQRLLNSIITLVFPPHRDLQH